MLIIQGAFALSSEFDVGFNPCAPLIVGFIVGFLSSTHAATIGRSLNKQGVIYSYPHINRFLVPGVIGAIVSGIVQACNNGVNGDHGVNRLSGRTAVMQGGWQILGILITTGIAMLAGLIIGIIVKALNNHNREDQFNDEIIYDDIPTELPRV